MYEVKSTKTSLTSALLMKFLYQAKQVGGHVYVCQVYRFDLCFNDLWFRQLFFVFILLPILNT